MVKVEHGSLVQRSTQSYSYQSSDVNMNVFSIIDSWISGSITHEGFIIKHTTDLLEKDTNDYGQLKFFSKETHTIHQPKIRIGWDDLFETGSLSALTLTEDIKLNTKRLKKSYKVGTTPKIEVHGRELYPARTFSNTLIIQRCKLFTNFVILSNI